MYRKYCLRDNFWISNFFETYFRKHCRCKKNARDRAYHTCVWMLTFFCVYTCTYILYVWYNCNDKQQCCSCLLLHVVGAQVGITVVCCWSCCIIDFACKYLQTTSYVLLSVRVSSCILKRGVWKCTGVRMHWRVCTYQVPLLLLAVCCIQQCSSVLLMLDVNLMQQQWL